MTTVFTLVVDGESRLQKTGPLTVHDVKKAQEAFDELVYRTTKQDGAINGFVTNEETKRVPYKM